MNNRVRKAYSVWYTSDGRTLRTGLNITKAAPMEPEAHLRNRNRATYLATVPIPGHYHQQHLDYDPAVNVPPCPLLRPPMPPPTQQTDEPEQSMALTVVAAPVDGEPVEAVAEPVLPPFTSAATAADDVAAAVAAVRDAEANEPSSTTTASGSGGVLAAVTAAQEAEPRGRGRPRLKPSRDDSALIEALRYWIKLCFSPDCDRFLPPANDCTEQKLSMRSPYEATLHSLSDVAAHRFRTWGINVIASHEIILTDLELEHLTDMLGKLPVANASEAAWEYFFQTHLMPMLRAMREGKVTQNNAAWAYAGSRGGAGAIRKHWDRPPKPRHPDAPARVRKRGKRQPMNLQEGQRPSLGGVGTHFTRVDALRWWLKIRHPDLHLGRLSCPSECFDTKNKSRRSEETHMRTSVEVAMNRVRNWALNGLSRAVALQLTEAECGRLTAIASELPASTESDDWDNFDRHELTPVLRGLKDGSTGMPPPAGRWRFDEATNNLEQVTNGEDGVLVPPPSEVVAEDLAGYENSSVFPDSEVITTASERLRSQQSNHPATDLYLAAREGLMKRRSPERKWNRRPRRSAASTRVEMAADESGVDEFDGGAGPIDADGEPMAYEPIVSLYAPAESHYREFEAAHDVSPRPPRRRRRAGTKRSRPDPYYEPPDTEYAPPPNAPPFRERKRLLPNTSSHQDVKPVDDATRAVQHDSIPVCALPPHDHLIGGEMSTSAFLPNGPRSGSILLLHAGDTSRRSGRDHDPPRRSSLSYHVPAPRDWPSRSSFTHHVPAPRNQPSRSSMPTGPTPAQAGSPAPTQAGTLHVVATLISEDP